MRGVSDRAGGSVRSVPANITYKIFSLITGALGKSPALRN